MRQAGHDTQITTDKVRVTCCHHKPETPPQPEHECTPFEPHNQGVVRDEHVVHEVSAEEQHARHYHGVGSVAGHHDQQ